MSRGLSAGWRRLFWLEVGICVATAVSWLVVPWPFLSQVAGFTEPDLRHHLLLLMTANVVVCAYGWMYARMLRMRPFPQRAFRLLQEAMLLGDIGILIISAAQWLWLRPDPLLLATQAGMACAWGVARGAFLLSSTRGGDDVLV